MPLRVVEWLFRMLLVTVALVWTDRTPALADRVPANCSGSGLGINLFTSIPDVHVGDRLFYSVNVFNGIPGSGRIVCDATEIDAFIVTPDGKTNVVTLLRRTLHQGESDFYPDVVSYVVRAQDIQADGTILATARDIGVIHQNDVNSSGGGFQGVNTQVNEPCVQISALCVGGVGETGLITFTGKVTNCGNTTLVGVTVTNFVNNGSFVVLFPTNLAVGQVVSFSGSWIPAVSCIPSVAVLTVRASDEFTSTPRLVTSSATVACQNLMTPGIRVTKECPPAPVSPGQLLRFTGSVSNTGNITLTNIVVLNDQPVGNTPVFTLASLAPGAVAKFSGSYPAPTNCLASDTLIARASGLCGGEVSSTASATCAVLTTPAIVVTQNCPTGNVLQGSLVTYTGLVKNVGDVPLTNVVVMSDRPAVGTVIFTQLNLAVGASAGFTASYLVPTNCCVVSGIIRATAQGCAGDLVSDSDTRTCPVMTTPRLMISKICSPASVKPGEILSYSGSITNVGNITLVQVVVKDPMVSNGVPILGPITLAPGESAVFAASMLVPQDFCGDAPLTVSGLDVCTFLPVSSSVSNPCLIQTKPRIAVTKHCPLLPTVRGGLYTFTGTVTNPGNVTLVNVYVMDNQPTNNTPVLGPITLAPGASMDFSGSYVAPVCCCLIIDTLTARGQDRCSGSNVASTATAVCPLLSNPALTLLPNCPPNPLEMGSVYSFSGRVLNSGDVVLTNVFVFGPQGTNSPVLGPIELAPGESEAYSGTYTVPFNVCSVDVSASGRDTCGDSLVTRASGCPVSTTPGLSLTQICPPGPVSPGMPLIFTGTLRNSGNITLTNVVVRNSMTGSAPLLVVPSLDPGFIVNFGGTFSTPTNCQVLNVSTATARSLCGVGVTNSTSTVCPIVTTPGLLITQSCPIVATSPGGLVLLTGSVRNTGDIALTNVVVGNSLAGTAPVLVVPTLNPGASMNFSASFSAPTNCSVVSVSTATGQSVCGVPVSNQAISVCPILTAPALLITQACPVTSPAPGGLLQLTGSVRNTGNIPLTNVVVLNSQTGTTPVLIVPMMNPGVSTNFSVSFSAPVNCSLLAVSTVTGTSICGASITNSATSTCPILTAPALVITQFCPPTATSPGAPLIFSGTVLNSGNIALNNVVVTNDHSGNAPLVSIATLLPGASAPFSGSYTAPANGPSVSTSTVRATSACGDSVLKSASSTCPIVTAPGLAITKLCPPTPVAPGATLVFTGTLTNTGNVTLTNVVVRNSQPVPGTLVLGPVTLAPGSGTNFSGSYLTPLNVCTVSDTLIVTATDQNSGLFITNSAAAQCSLLATPSLVITQLCPPTSATPGSLLTFSGTVLNSGNITLNNVVVTNDHSGNGPLVSIATLLPGASAPFSGSYTAPASGPSVSTSTVHATSACGDSLVKSASSSCPIVAAPGLAITKLCPPTPVAPGAILVFTGTLTNTGNVMLTNVVVRNSQPVPGTVVLGPITLAPGAGTNFSGSYLTSLNVCTVSDTLIVTGNDSNTGTVLTNSATAQCPLLTTPALVITQLCPPTSSTPGSLLTFSGTVLNSGNITLNNVVVTNDHSGNAPLVSIATLLPGASAPFSGSYIAPASGPSVSTSTVHATSACGDSVVKSASSSCPIVTAPGLAITKLCPPTPVAPGATLVFTGTLTNTGNVTLTNVVVRNSQPVPGTVVLGPITLAPGAGTNFSGSYLTSLNVCTVSDTLIVTGNDSNTGTVLTNSVTAQCPLLTTPSLVITQLCPPTSSTPGSLLTFSGTVLNSGNITLNNVVVTNDHSGNLPLVSIATLLPGASAPFSGSYTAPGSGPSVSTSTVHATSVCGDSLVKSASSSCPIVTAPGLAIAKFCPPTPVAPGATLVFTGTLTNTGNVTLTNVVVRNSQPVPGTVVLGPITLAPGAGTSFSGGYVVPPEACSMEDTLSVVGSDSSSGSPVTASTSATCVVSTTPGILVTEVCPAGTVVAGTTVTFTGEVRNTGNITLNQVFVFSSQPTNTTPLLGPIVLAPGASASFAGSYVAQVGTGYVTNRTILTNLVTMLTTNVTSTIITNQSPVVTTIPATPYQLGTIASVPRTFTDRFVLSTNFSGLTYAGEDHGYAATQLYSMRNNGGSTTFFDTITASTASSADRFDAGNRAFDALTYAAPDLGYGPLLFYYLRHDANGVSTFGSITPGGVVGVTTDHFVVGSRFDALTFTATDVGFGANLFYYVRHDASGLSTFGTINPALPGTITDRFTMGTNVDALVFTDLAAPGFGPNQFYYLRHDAAGVSTFGTLAVTGLTTGTVTDRFTVGSNAAELTFTATDLGFGANQFYYLRGHGVQLSTNQVITLSTNNVITILTNSVQNFVTNSVVLFTPTHSVRASGVDACQSRTVAAAADCFGAVATSSLVKVSSLSLTAGGGFKLSFQTEAGKTYRVQRNSTLNESTWTDLKTVLGTGADLPVPDPSVSSEASQFYRVIELQ